MVFISQVEVLITLVVITSNSKLGCFSFFLFFSCNLSNNIFPNILLEMIDAAPLETIVDEDEEGDSDIEID